eukprot:TRINITY_DN92468_c0_g1_i1.p1 TRINITY_DN92468_c0_g1~~TRINITY_DN92468_c0_g1_i1.p1  ORF type:complete len:238 (-),score=54.15 TRINITY_DN92468_c0_g1_i1:293-943(-)
MARVVKRVAVAAVAACAVGPALSFLTPGLAPSGKGSPEQRTSSLRPQMEASQPVIDTSSPLRLGGAVASLLAALVVAVLPVADAHAAKTGGRMGGGNKTVVNKTIVNKTTIVKQAPAPAPPPPVVVAPAPAPVIIGAPVMAVAPAPSLGDVIIGGVVQGAVSGMVSNAMHSSVPHSNGVSTTDKILENQQRQDERQLDRQANQIEDLQRELAALRK